MMSFKYLQSIYGRETPLSRLIDARELCLQRFGVIIIIEVGGQIDLHMTFLFHLHVTGASLLLFFVDLLNQTMSIG